MAKASKAAPAEAQGANNAPLFFTQPAMVDKSRHATAGLSTKTDLSFARDTNSVPLNTIEFLEAGKHYPIVFTSDEESVPVAILGWEKENYFITADNLWQPHTYVPAYVRQYPFIFFEDQASQKYFLCLDEGASIFEAEAGADALPLFVEGEPSEMAKRALEFCTAFYQHLGITRNFCADLKKHKLLSPYNSSATINGKELHLGGFLMIDEKAFNALSPEVFMEFREKGWLPFIYLALASGTNWKQLIEFAPQRR